jgi:Cft2 family RNA processing exonuclease
MQFTNLTRKLEIGANSYLLEIDGRRVVLDSGMHPRNTGQDATPDFSLVADDSIDAALITHAHQDHIGTLPVLLRRQQKAKIFMTEPTRQISDVMLHNSVNVMLRQREDSGLANNLLFTHREADVTVKRAQPVPLRQAFSLDGERIGGGDDSEPAVEFHDAGHILGSAGILIRHKGRRVFYTGDVNFDDQTISRAARFPEEKLDALIIECTRGDSPAPHGYTRAAEVHRLCEALGEAIQRGCVLVPVFALGKTQELLAMLYGMFQRGHLPRVPIYIGGMSTKLTEIYDRFAKTSPRLLPELDLMDDVSPISINSESPEMIVKNKRIFALSSGMMTEKTLSNSFARRLLGDPANSIFFIGYADPDSPAGKLRSAKQGDMVQLDAGAAPEKLRCDVRVFNFSGHSTRDTLIDFVKKTTPRKVLLVHGDTPAIEWMRDTIATALPQSEIILPQPGQTVKI